MVFRCILGATQQVLSNFLKFSCVSAYKFLVVGASSQYFYKNFMKSSEMMSLIIQVGLAYVLRRLNAFKGPHNES